MCGIFAYAGKKKNAGKVVLEGLKRLDYRGYDSWGVAALSGNKIAIKKKAGRISDVQSLDMPESSLAIAHTRWATTGATTDVNAHPHLSTDRTFALAQNGIVENYKELKATLQKKGYMFISQTDTEVIVRLIEEKQKKIPELRDAVQAAFNELEGRNTIILIANDGRIIAARNGSPLVLGLNPKTNELYLSSDTLSFAEHASKMVIIENQQLVEVKDGVTIYNVQNGKKVKHTFEDIGFVSAKVDKEGFDTFMMKEINEAPFVLHQLVKQDGKKYEELADAIKKAKNVYTIGSGGAGVAAAQVAFYLRDIGKVKAVSLIGADAMEYVDLLKKGDLILAISQSGETADVLEVLEAAKEKNVTIASFINMPGSMMGRMSEYSMMSESGPEICVMSTKTFVAQVGFGYLLAKTVAGRGVSARTELKKLARNIDTYLKTLSTHAELKKIARILSKKHDIFLLGKYQNFHIIREGMVKIIEASYKHGHALPSGDLKHYVITLMEKGVPVITVLSNDKAKTDVMSAIDEVRLRGAEVYAIASENSEAFDYHIQVPDTGETSAIMNLIPLQLLAYYLAIELGNDVDKPRNIAKSVTVK